MAYCRQMSAHSGCSLSQGGCWCLHLAHCQAQVNEPDDRYIALAQPTPCLGQPSKGGSSSSSLTIFTLSVLQECPVLPKVLAKRQANNLITGVPTFQRQKIQSAYSKFGVLRLDIVQLMTQSFSKYLNTVDYSGIRLPVN